jgi:hypothetical protein
MLCSAKALLLIATIVAEIIYVVRGQRVLERCLLPGDERSLNFHLGFYVARLLQPCFKTGPAQSGKERAGD